MCRVKLAHKLGQLTTNFVRGRRAGTGNIVHTAKLVVTKLEAHQARGTLGLAAVRRVASDALRLSGNGTHRQGSRGGVGQTTCESI